MPSFSTEMQDQIKEDLWNRQLDSFRSAGSRPAITRAPRERADEPTATTHHHHAILTSGRPIEM